MILAIDIGNTNIKIGGWDSNHLSFVSRVQTNTKSTDDEYAIALLDIFRLGDFNIAQFDGAIISSVVPQLSMVLAKAIKKVIQTDRVILISPGIKTGLNIKIDDPASLGSDLVCAAVSVVSKYPLPCIMISLGTATAMFAINEKAEFLGGSVSPGVQVGMDALSRNTAQLPYISLVEPGPAIGRNTNDSMKAGAIYGAASMLDGMIERMQEELGGTATVVATGGLAEYVIPHCKKEIVIAGDLVLEGLNIIYHKNI